MFINFSIFVYRGFYMTLSEAQNIFRQNSWTTCSASFDNSYSCSAIASFNSSWDPEPEPEPEPWRSVPCYTGWCGTTGVTAYTTEVTNNPIEEAWRAVPVFGPSEDNDQYENEQEENLVQYAGSNDYYNPAPQVEHSYIDDYMNKETEISKLVQQYNELIE